MIARLIAKIFGTANERNVRTLRTTVEHINSLEPRIQALSDEQLAQQTLLFRERLARGEGLDSLLPEAFATVRETARRTIGQRHFDVQLIGGMVLHHGKIAEMKTGEGKTLTATLPLYLNALEGKGAHLVTVNDYLARRDAEWMSQIYGKLGLSTGVIQNGLSDSQRREVYARDIVYGTNNELGFDYLRDNMKFRLDDYVQRELHYAIVDEVDSILIDEARTPLIISGSSDESSQLYEQANRIVATLRKDEDYTVDEKQRSVHMLEPGIDKVEAAFGIANLYAVENIKLLHHTNQALKAHAIFKRDVDYVVRDGEVLIVDEFTGRILQGRRYSDGLHQALEAKEHVTIERETQTLASITLQNLFRLYKKLAGMTGTAATESEEFFTTYKLDVVSIPTNRPAIRIDKPDLIFLTRKAKYEAIVKDIQERHKKGQPVLIGTISIEISELLSLILTQHGIAHEVLNAKQHAREAEIVANAGLPGRVTIATNMAGRGTDIKLSPESIAAGGLYILGTERHESRRIDNQLRGRSGRQGDPGESRFYISLEDDLIRIFAGDNLKRQMHRVGMKEDEVIESRFVSRIIENAQERVEKQNFEYRKHLLEYDDVLNQQRMVVYAFRRQALQSSEDITAIVRDIIADAVSDTIEQVMANAEGGFTAATREAIITQLCSMTHLNAELFAGVNTANSETFTSDAINALLLAYDELLNAADEERLSHIHRWLLLESIDQAWKQHMLNLDQLKEGIGLRGWGQKNPLNEYKKEAFYLFESMMRSAKADIAHHIFRTSLEHFDEQALERRREKELQSLNLQGAHAPTASDDTSVDAYQRTQGGGTVVRSEEKVSRNAECTCGSGKKYKKCCGN